MIRGVLLPIIAPRLYEITRVIFRFSLYITWTKDALPTCIDDGPVDLITVWLRVSQSLNDYWSTVFVSEYWAEGPIQSPQAHWYWPTRLGPTLNFSRLLLYGFKKLNLHSKKRKSLQKKSIFFRKIIWKNQEFKTISTEIGGVEFERRGLGQKYHLSLDSKVDSKSTKGLPTFQQKDKNRVGSGRVKSGYSKEGLTYRFS